MVLPTESLITEGSIRALINDANPLKSKDYQYLYLPEHAAELEKIFHRSANAFGAFNSILPFVSIDAVTKGLMQLRVANENAQELTRQTSVALIDLSPHNNIPSIFLTLRGFRAAVQLPDNRVRTYSKDATHTLSIQRAGATIINEQERPDLWDERTKYDNSLVVVVDDGAVFPMLTQPDAPNNPTGITFQYGVDWSGSNTQEDTPPTSGFVELPLITTVPLLSQFTQRTINHPGASMFSGRMAVLTRYPTYAISCEKSTTLQKPRGGAGTGSVVPAR